ncbi:hypothetical protein BGX27_010371, partial [Mortierella sp. AM989]
MATRVLYRFSPQIQTSIRRSFATGSPSNPLLGSTVKSPSPVNGAKKEVKGAKSSTGSSSSSQSGPKIEPDPNPLKLLFQGHKHQRLAIGVVILCALAGDGCFTYFTFIRKRKEEELIRTDTVSDMMVEKVGP